MSEAKPPTAKPLTDEELATYAHKHVRFPGHECGPCSLLATIDALKADRDRLKSQLLDSLTARERLEAKRRSARDGPRCHRCNDTGKLLECPIDALKAFLSGARAGRRHASDLVDRAHQQCDLAGIKGLPGADLVSLPERVRRLRLLAEKTEAVLKAAQAETRAEIECVHEFNEAEHWHDPHRPRRRRDAAIHLDKAREARRTAVHEWERKK